MDVQGRESHAGELRCGAVKFGRKVRGSQRREKCGPVPVASVYPDPVVSHELDTRWPQGSRQMWDSLISYNAVARQNDAYNP